MNIEKLREFKNAFNGKFTSIIGSTPALYLTPPHPPSFLKGFKQTQTEKNALFTPQYSV